MDTYHFDTFCLTGFTYVYFVKWNVFRVSIFSCRPPYKLLHFKYIRLDSILSLSFALCGLIMIPPWLNTRSMGELLAGTDSTLIARGKSLGRLFLFTNQKCRQALGPFSLRSNSYGMPLVLLFGNYRYLQIFEDISNSFTDICNSFTDILKYLQISLNI